MRDNYPLGMFFAALKAWEAHERDYLAALSKAGAPTPSTEALENYKRIYIEGYLEALSDANQ